MERNNFDLCADTVTLDYEELLKTAQVGVKYAKWALERELNAWYEPNRYPTNLNAEWMLDSAKALATATTALHYLLEGRKRKVVKIAREA